MFRIRQRRSRPTARPEKVEPQRAALDYATPAPEQNEEDDPSDSRESLTAFFAHLIIEPLPLIALVTLLFWLTYA